MVYNETFRDEKLNLGFWRLQQPWGWMNVKNGIPSQYYDKNGEFTETTQDGLSLRTKYLPIEIQKTDLPLSQQKPTLPDSFTVDWLVGLISSKRTFKYGWFGVEIKLPTGKGLWPALWLSGHDTWPPEIDVFEAYSRIDNKYSKKVLCKKRPNWVIQPNLHYGETSKPKQYGAYDCPINGAIDRYVQYVCLWEEDKIEIFYDGKSVFKTTDKDILEWFSQEMYIIINNGVISDIETEESEMMVRNFMVYQQNGSR
jgi:hypothetical protein